MVQYAIKILVTALIIVAVSEIGKRSSFFAAVLASLPLTSILALCWLYYETNDQQKVIDLAYGILWLVVPSLVFFLALPTLIKMGVSFLPSLAVSVIATFGAYLGFVYLLRATGIKP
jgi:hypothetical protein